MKFQTKKYLIILKFISFNETILFPACESGNIDLVKYLISLNKININAIDISIIFL